MGRTNYLSFTLTSLILILILLSVHKSHASHAAGGQIYYEYIGDSTGVNHQYLLTLTLYRRTAGIQFNNTAVVDINSSCYPTQSITLNAGNNQNVPLIYFGECMDTNLGASLVNYYEYQGVVTLPGLCSDFRFSYDICCRNNDIDNLATYPAIYLESALNNFLGPNDSPQIYSEGSKAFCIGAEVNWSQSAKDADGDSLYYELIQPLSDYNQVIPWAPGYGTLQPITTTNGVNLNPRTGDFIFQPAQTETVVVRFRVSEYRTDTVFPTFYKIGHVDRDVQIYILNNCPVGSSGISFSTTDSLTADTAALACGQKKLTIQFSGRIDCRSIAPDGTDFALFNSYGNLIPIIAAGSDSCSGKISNSLWLEFYDSIYYNDDLNLVIRTGSDLNTIESVCGLPLSEGDSLPLKVSNCSSSIDIPKYQGAGWDFYPNPARDHIQLSLHNSGKVKYDILDMSGQTRLRGTLYDKNGFIDISSLPTGIYLLRLRDYSHTEIRKFLKQ